MTGPLAEQVPATPADWHDGCPRCPHCGLHRHGGTCPEAAS